MAKVVIIGGGVAGMSAAHELIERGFEVEVYEKNPIYPGGKARSVDVPRTNLQFPDKYLPGEHGFRFFPGFYKHVIDTMKRIPYTNANGDENEQGVFDNLVEVNRCAITRYGKKPIIAPVNFPQSMDDIKVLLDDLHAGTGLTDAEKKLFAFKIWQLMTSCTDRRDDEYERLGWWEFMEADSNSATYQSLCVEGLTRTLVAANAKYASTKTGGDIFLQLIFNMFNPFTHTDRVLNGPTNDVWINPWLKYLEEKGVKYFINSPVANLEYQNNKIAGVWVSINKTEPKLVTGDYYILATPVEVAAKMITDEMVNYDATLDGIRKLAPSVAWMNGLQFYLSEDVEIVHGHCIYTDSQWAVTSISQVQFWQDYDLSVRGNGKVKGIISVDISNWDEKGLNGKKGVECTAEEIKDEVWAEMKKSLNVDDNVVLRDDMIIDWFLDGDIHTINKSISDVDSDKIADSIEGNFEPLLVNTVNSWDLRPFAYCRISNLFFASDYVQTYTDLATMEGANEAARRAVNCILDASGSDALECEIWNLHEPGILAPLKMHDKKRYDNGLPYKYHEPLIMKLAHWIKDIF